MCVRLSASPVVTCALSLAPAKRACTMTSHFRLRWIARRTEIDHRNQRLFCLRQRRRRGCTAQPGLQALLTEPGDKPRLLQSVLPHFRPVSAFRWRRFGNLPAIVIAIRLAAAGQEETVRQIPRRSMPAETAAPAGLQRRTKVTTRQSRKSAVAKTAFDWIARRFTWSDHRHAQPSKSAGVSPART